MTDWFLLLLIVPMILVPIVLLFGFAGCSAFGSSPADTKPAAPANLSAIATGTDGIKLTWTDNSAGKAKFDVERTATKETLKDKSPGFVDGGRDDGTDFGYTVRAIVAGETSDPSNEATATTKPNAPTNLVAKPEPANKIGLTWKYNTKSNKNVKFELEHTLQTTPPTANPIPAGGTTGTGEKSHGYSLPVAPGSEVDFRVRAVVDGFDNSAPKKDIASEPSNLAKAIAFKTYFSATLIDQPGGGGGGASLDGHTLVQRIEPSSGKPDGNVVLITLAGATGSDVKISKVYISQAAATGDPYDAGTDLKLVDGLAGPITVPKGESFTLKSADYTLDPTKPLLVAFDIEIGGALKRADAVSAAVAKAYYRQGPPEAGTADRTSGYTLRDRVYLIEKIEVGTSA